MLVGPYLRLKHMSGIAKRIGRGRGEDSVQEEGRSASNETELYA